MYPKRVSRNVHQIVYTQKYTYILYTITSTLALTLEKVNKYKNAAFQFAIPICNQHAPLA